MHIDEDFTHGAVFIFTGAQEHLVAPNDRFLRVPLTACRQAALFWAALDDFFNDTFTNNRSLLNWGCGLDGFDQFLGLVIVHICTDQATGAQRLAKL